MIIASPKDQKTKKMHKMFVEKKNSFLVHIEFLDNKHRCMRVIDTKRAIY
jgi:hypothetical protein